MAKFGEAKLEFLVIKVTIQVEPFCWFNQNIFLSIVVNV